MKNPKMYEILLKLLRAGYIDEATFEETVNNDIMELIKSEMASERKKNKKKIRRLRKGDKDSE